MDLQGFEIRKKHIILRYESGEQKIDPTFFAEKAIENARKEVAADNAVPKLAKLLAADQGDTELKQIAKWERIVTNREISKKAERYGKARYQALRASLFQSIETLVKGA